jgi:hypothetical protein
MAAGNFILTDEYKRYQFVSKLDLESDLIKFALFGTGHTPAVASNAVWADLSGEISHGSYTSGGTAVSSPAVSEISAPSGDWKFSTSNWQLTFTSTNSPAIKWAWLYIDATVDSIVKPLIGYFELESGSSVTVLAGNTLTLQTPTNGWYRWNGARS